MSLSAFAQKKEKDLTYFYYELDQNQSFISYLKARKEFDSKKVDFKLPSSTEAVKEIEDNEESILKNEKTYAAFLSRYGMQNSGEYAKLWFGQLNSLKTFIRKNPKFNNLSAQERQNIIDKWYFSDTLSK